MIPVIFVKINLVTRLPAGATSIHDDTRRIRTIMIGEEGKRRI